MRLLRVAIQYEPRYRGLRLAIGYFRIERPGRKGVFDLYGFMAGYSGGGCYDDLFFHVGQRAGEGYVSYTPACGERWEDDIIGVSGFGGTAFAPEIECLLNDVRARMFDTWICWTEPDMLPDLQDSAKRRLNCTRRKVFHMSRGFDWNLLPFLTGSWPISLSFGETAEGFARAFRRFRAVFEARSRGLERVLAKYPELIEDGLQTRGRQVEAGGIKANVLYTDRLGRKLIVRSKWGPPTSRDIALLTSAKRTLPRREKERVRFMLAGTGDLEPDIKSALDRAGIEWRQIAREELRRFLAENCDDKLVAVFSRKAL